MKKLGRCSRCGEKRTHYKQLCDRCQGLFTAYVRAWRLSKHQNVQVAITTQS
jgi:predicted amidophosphoribosyltransferase